MLALRPVLRHIARFSASKRTPLRPSRRLLTAESEGASKGGAAEAASEAKPKESSSGRLALLAATLATFGVGYAAYEITENPEGELAQKYHGSAVEGAVNQALGGLWEWFAGMHKPQLDKVMDDWPYPGYPANIPPPPLLVLDVEKTILGSEWDSKYGWRHAVRPGVYEFLKEVSTIFEVVLITENDAGTMYEMLNGVKGTEFVTKIVGNSAMRMQRGTMLKDLSVMNRPVNKILVIDDNPKACKLCEDNTIYIKPFTNLRDKKDRSLMELVPFLQALYLEQKLDDIPSILREMRTHDGHEIAVDYERRLQEAAFQKQMAKRKGLGGLLRGANPTANAPDAAETARTPRLLPSVTDVVGAAPQAQPASRAPVGPGVAQQQEEEKPKGKKKAGGFIQQYRQLGAEEEERQRRKMEKMNEIAQRRELEKRQQQQY